MLVDGRVGRACAADGQMARWPAKARAGAAESGRRTPPAALAQALLTSRSNASNREDPPS